MEIFIITFIAFKDSAFNFDVFTVWATAEDADKAREKARKHADEVYFKDVSYNHIQAHVCPQDKYILKSMLDKITGENAAQSDGEEWQEILTEQ